MHLHFRRAVLRTVPWFAIAAFNAACGKGATPDDAAAPAPAPLTTPSTPTPAADVQATAPAATTPDATPAPAPEPAADAAPSSEPEPAADAAPPSEPAATPAADAAAPSNRPRGQEIEIPAGEDPIFDRLQRVIGQGGPVAIVPTIEGLAGVSADGSRWTLLHKGIVPWAVVDERARVVWFAQAIDTREDGDEWVSVHAIDMLAPTVSATRISARLPGSAVFVVSYPKRGPEGRDEQIWNAIGRGAIVTLVVDAKRPRLEASGGVYMDMGLIDADAHRAAVKAGAPDAAAVALVKRFAERAGERSNTLPKPAPPSLPERLDVPKSSCEDEELCGTWHTWPGQPWVAVVYEHSCGDSCFTRMTLWHVEKKEFMALADGPNGVIPSSDDGLAYPIIAPDGSAWLDGGQLMRPGAKPWTWPVPENVVFAAWGGGWLGGQFTLY